MHSPTPAEIVEARDYVFCTAFYPAPDYARRFVVIGTRSRAVARVAAWAYARRHWGMPRDVKFYPGNYIVQAREHVALGNYTRPMVGEKGSHHA